MQTVTPLNFYISSIAKTISTLPVSLAKYFQEKFHFVLRYIHK